MVTAGALWAVFEFVLVPRGDTPFVCRLNISLQFENHCCCEVAWNDVVPTSMSLILLRCRSTPLRCFEQTRPKSSSSVWLCCNAKRLISQGSARFQSCSWLMCCLFGRGRVLVRPWQYSLAEGRASTQQRLQAWLFRASEQLSLRMFRQFCNGGEKLSLHARPHPSATSSCNLDVLAEIVL